MTAKAPIEVWGGLECTVARVGDRFRDQAAETGHRDRPGDLDRIAALGIRTLRYPVLWETVSPGGAAPDWRWHDRQLGRMRELGVAPIAGLIHHGSGPAGTDLLDPDFPRRLAAHAGRVARRYPWIDRYTPVNEPLTTARFSTLYGHWYPHARSYGAFLRALVNQCRAAVLAMREIRRVNPDARLVQTEDLGKTFATPPLAYQAEHENGRRWLSFDLLFGRVDRHHPWWRILTDHGIGARELGFFLRADARPDIVGINHYLTSERFLDGRLDRYPAHLWGGNGRDRYADVEAVRVNLPGADLGPASRLREVWARYGTEIAVTEVHHGCTRDEQLRWLREVWRAAETVRVEGADIRAVTPWSLFGAVDWNTLLTQENGIYEPGAFDVRGPAPRPTALAGAVASLAKTGDFDHPVLDRPGWWRRDTRFYRPTRMTAATRLSGSPRSLLVVGDGGPAAKAFARIAAARGLDHAIVPASGVEAARRSLAAARPWAVVDLSGEGASLAALATDCRLAGLPFLSISGTPLFDGTLGRAARETDPPQGRDAAAGRAISWERHVLDRAPKALMVRTGPLFGPWDEGDFALGILRDLAAGRQPAAAAPSDIVSPTYLPDLIHVALDLLIDGESGVRHLASGAASPAELAAGLARRAGLPVPDAGDGAPLRNLALDTERGALMPPLASALDRFVADCEADWRLSDPIRRIAAE